MINQVGLFETERVRYSMCLFISAIAHALAPCTQTEVAGDMLQLVNE